MGGISLLKNEISLQNDSLEIQKESFRNIVTGKICKLMEDEAVTKSGLARKLGISKAAITNLLSGDRNFTIDKITEIACILGYKPSIFFNRRNSFSEIEFRSFIRFFEKKRSILDLSGRNGSKMKFIEESEKNFEILIRQ